MTGPYLIPFGITTFLFSKEWYNWDDSAVRGLLVWVIISFAVKELGPMASQENKELLEDMTGTDFFIPKISAVSPIKKLGNNLN